jgi:(1->4)-alpha-D-glucan 1-alpha-D-glucosylmutase
VLQTRHAHPAAFRGGYAPLAVEDNDSLVAFARSREAVSLAQTRGDPMGRVTLPDGDWRNVLTNQSLRGGGVALSDLLGDLNVALLVRETPA